MPIEELLTPDEVLRRYTAGPKDGVFSDGSCDGNPGPGGWGFVWVENDGVVAEQSGTDPATTNNRMELRALIEPWRSSLGRETRDGRCPRAASPAWWTPS